jgi:hypothetical protein
MPSRSLYPLEFEVLQKRNTEFFSLELCPAIAIIRGAMAGNKTDRSGHVKNPAVTPSGSNVSTTTILGVHQ